MIYIYEGGDRLYLHTSDHAGHILQNVRAQPRVCVGAADMGAVQRGKPYACNSALLYTSVIVFGSVRIVEDQTMKPWFFDRILEKYVEPEWTFKPGYPAAGSNRALRAARRDSDGEAQ